MVCFKKNLLKTCVPAHTCRRWCFSHTIFYTNSILCRSWCKKEIGNLSAKIISSKKFYYHSTSRFENRNSAQHHNFFDDDLALNSMWKTPASTYVYWCFFFVICFFTVPLYAYILSFSIGFFSEVCLFCCCCCRYCCFCSYESLKPASYTFSLTPWNIVGFLKSRITKYRDQKK